MDDPFSWYFIVARIDISSVRLVFWDLGGQEDLQTLWDKVRVATHVDHVHSCILSPYHDPCVHFLTITPCVHSLAHVDLQYYSECHAVVYVIDSCDPENLAVSAQTFSTFPPSSLCVAPNGHYWE